MSSTPKHTIESHHKSWFNDIERWDYDLRIWNKHREELLADARNFVTLVEQFASDVQSHERAVDQHRKSILNCERMMVEHSRTDQEQQAISEAHEAARGIHQQQFSEHHRLEQLRHNLMSRLSLLHSTAPVE